MKQTIALLAFWLALGVAEELPPPCDSDIYCKGGPGTLLHTVQTARVFNDSKTFVDMPLKHSAQQVRANFDLLMKVRMSRRFDREINTLH